MEKGELRLIFPKILKSSGLLLSIAALALSYSSNLHSQTTAKKQPCEVFYGQASRLADFEAKFVHLSDIAHSIDKQPQILMGAMEWGALNELKNTKGQSLKGKMGGLGVIIQDLLEKMPQHLKEQGGGRLSVGLPAFDGVDLAGLEKLNPVDVLVSGKKESVGVYRYQHPSGAEVLFYEHPDFRKRTVLENTETHNIYAAPVKDQEQESGRFFSLFNQALAKTYDEGGYNVYHGHDYHSALTPFYTKDKTGAVALSVHNGGYHGAYIFPNFGGAQRLKSERYPQGIPGGDSTKLREHLKSMNIDFDTYMKYFEWDGSFSTLKGSLKYNHERSLVSASPVSTGYADEIKVSRGELLDKIRKQKHGKDPRNESQVYVPSGNLDFGRVRGIDNGVEDGQSAWANTALHQVKAEKELNEWITHPALRKAFLEGDLNFGAKLDTPLEKAEALKAKARTKELLQLNAFGKASPEKPVFVVISRLVDQKNIQVFADNIEHVVKMGGQVIAGGSAGDAQGRAVVETLSKLQKKYPESVHFKEGFVEGQAKAVWLAGADYTVLPSKFEPFGIVDVEFAMNGALPIVRKTGGLSKVKAGYAYDYLDSSDFKGEKSALRKLLTEVITNYKKNPAEIEARRIEAMSQAFPWNRSLDQYLDVYRSSGGYQVVREIQSARNEGVLTDAQMKVYLTKFVSGLSARSREALRSHSELLDKPSPAESLLKELLATK